MHLEGTFLLNLLSYLLLQSRTFIWNNSVTENTFKSIFVCLLVNLHFNKRNKVACVVLLKILLLFEVVFAIFVFYGMFHLELTNDHILNIFILFEMGIC
jgi:uncharacterized membrane protein